MSSSQSQPGIGSVTTFQPTNQMQRRDIAKEAYNAAVKFLQKELSTDKKARDIIFAATKIEDVGEAVKKVKEHYEHRVKKTEGVRNLLHKLSLRIYYYGGVLDALSQHHPEYVALAWGSIKFVLMGIIKHAELVEKLARALNCIGQVLPEVELSAELYQTDLMRDAVAALYTEMITFFIRAVSWYKKSAIRRAFSSIIKPFDLEYEDTVIKIKECSELIRRIASGESRIEVRDIHVMVTNMRSELQGELCGIRSQLDEVIKVASVNKAITEGIHDRVQDMHPRIHDIQHGHIISTLKPPLDPEEMLFKGESLARRHQRKTGSHFAHTGILDALDQWVINPNSSFLILHPGPRANSVAKELAINIISHIRTTKQNVFWNISPPCSSDSIPSTISILRSLVFQILKREPDILLGMPRELNVSKFNSTHTELEWFDLLCRMVSRVRACFLVIESEDLYRLCSGNPGWTRNFLALFHRLADLVQTSGARVKVLVVNFEGDSSRLVEHTGDSPRIVASVKRPNPVPPRSRRTKSQASRSKALLGRSMFMNHLRLVS